jgi:hypothetical protein
MVVITPAYDPATNDDPERLARWDALAEGLRGGGVEGFVAAYGEPSVPPEWRETVLKVIRQRLSLHEHPEAVADALQSVPRSRPFGTLDELARLDVPAMVVASADEADPGHPQDIGEAYAEAIPGAQLILDEPGRSPVAWQGSQLSRLIAELAARRDLGCRRAVGAAMLERADVDPPPVQPPPLEPATPARRCRASSGSSRGSRSRSWAHPRGSMGRWASFRRECGCGGAPPDGST